MKLVYVLVGDGSSFYARMTVVSVLSFRFSNPTARVELVVDRQTRTSLKQNRSVILDIVDACLEVEVPRNPNAWQSRFLKTSLGSAVEGPFLFLDTDVLVRKSVAPLFSGTWDIAAARNHSRAERFDQIWSGDRETLEAMLWPLGEGDYLNSGVIYYAGNRASRAFAEAWHEAWLASWRKTSSYRDQPAFNYALRHTQCRVEELPDAWNAQIMTAPKSAFDAGIWHFYLSKEDKEATVFSELLTESQTASSADLRVSLEKALRKRIPWTKKSSVHHVENTIWQAYRQGARLRWSELGLLLGRRANWKNVLLSLFAGAGLSYEQFTKFLVWASRCRSRVVATARS